MDNIKRMTLLLAGLSGVCLSLINSLLLIFFPAYVPILTGVWVITLLVIIGMVGNKMTRGLTILAIVSPALLIGVAGGVQWGVPGTAVAVPSALLAYWVIEELWQFLVVVPERTLVVIRGQEYTRLVKQPEPMQFKPLKETLYARVPLYTMQSIVAVEQVVANDSVPTTIAVHLRYVLSDEEAWSKIVTMPDYPDMYRTIAQRLRGSSLQNAIFWEYLFDVVVQRETAPSLSTWMSEQSEKLHMDDSERLMSRVRETLQQKLQQWGLRMMHLELLAVKRKENG